MNEVTAIIPARLNSTRIKYKPLVKINGKTLVEYAVESCIQSCCFSRIIVTSESPEVLNYIKKYDVETIVTKSTHATGTERISEIVAKVSGEKFALIPCDLWPITKKSINDLIKPALHEKVQIASLVANINSKNEFEDVNTVKVYMDTNSFGINFSRAFYHNKESEYLYKSNILKKQIGLYFYTREIIDFFSHKERTAIEIIESNETHRFLYYGYKVYCPYTKEQLQPINTKLDIDILSSNGMDVCLTDY